jgi:segregation and condensation protein A
MDYKVKFEVFEGPLDLLLYLIKRDEVDVYEVNLTKLANEFIDYLEVMRLLDLEIAGEFLVMASTLMYIKSRELLPLDQQVVPEGEDEEEQDPRWDLIRQLVEYKKFKEVASRLQALEVEQELVFPRLPAPPQFEESAVSLKPEVSIFHLINAVNDVMKRVHGREDLRDIFEDKWTVSEKIESLLARLKGQFRFLFSELFDSAMSRSEVVVTFLAVLELIRLKRVAVSQSEAFGEIEITRSRFDPGIGVTPFEVESVPAT